MRRLLPIPIALALAVLLLHPSHAQGTVQVVQAEATYEFGQQVTIQATIQSTAPLEKVEVFLQAQGSDRTLVGEALLGENGQVFYLHDLQRDPLRAFATVLYWFRVTTTDGTVTTTPSFAFDYYDTRFDWQTLESTPFVVHWYQGDTAYAQRILDTAQEALKAIQDLIPVNTPERLDIYAYAKFYDLQSSLESINRHLVAGHAEPDLGIVVAALPPGPSFSLDVQQRIPHELAHILLYQYIGPRGMSRIPTWLDEGLASLVETFPNQDYATALEKAYEEDGLIPLGNLCTTFPTDASGAFLAYAEAQSFVQYLKHRFGSQGLQTLIQAYLNGGGCEAAPQLALGEPLSALERAWLTKTFDSPRLPWGNLLPWLLLLAISLAPIVGLASLGRARAQRTRTAHHP